MSGKLRQWFGGMKGKLAAAAALVVAAILFLAYVPGAELLFYPVLIFVYFGFGLLLAFGALVAMVLLLQYLSGRKFSVTGTLLKAAGWYAGIYLSLALFLGLWTAFQGSSSYQRLGGKSPLVLTGRQMAGSDKVTLAVEAYDNGGAAAVVTAPAADIIAANQAGSAGQRSRLRIIAASQGVTLTLTSGAGVMLDGEMTIPPGTWRDFSVRHTSGDAVTIKSTGTGDCPLDGRDLHDCRK